MLSYWIETGFSLMWKFSFAKLTMGIANILLFSFLITRWIESGHFPLSNLYESLIFLAWTLSSIHLFLEYQFQQTSVKTSPLSVTNVSEQPQFDLNSKTTHLIGSITSPTILLIQAFATLSLPTEMQMPSALVPALQSNWLMMHVTLMILSYGALILGCLFSVAYLIVARQQNLQIQGNSIGTKTLMDTVSTNSILTSSNTLSIETLDLNQENLVSSQVSTVESQNMTKIDKLAKMFDNLSYRILGIGFPLLTIGILSGAVWANEAWGSYWSWDPKETWAFLTWLIFAIYLHTRITKGWSGKGPALIASLGLLSVWICFLGVNLLGQGLHSYGWIAEKAA
jgi:cytochrome c-type biogenesis protein CcsB